MNRPLVGQSQKRQAERRGALVLSMPVLVRQMHKTGPRPSQDLLTRLPAVGSFLSGSQGFLLWNGDCFPLGIEPEAAWHQEAAAGVTLLEEWKGASCRTSEQSCR